MLHFHIKGAFLRFGALLCLVAFLLPSQAETSVSGACSREVAAAAEPIIDHAHEIALAKRNLRRDGFTDISLLGHGMDGMVFRAKKNDKWYAIKYPNRELPEAPRGEVPVLSAFRMEDSVRRLAVDIDREAGIARRLRFNDEAELLGELVEHEDQLEREGGPNFRRYFPRTTFVSARRRRPYLQMELFEQEGKSYTPTLTNVLRNNTLTLETKIEIIRQIFEAVTRAESLGIIHRDIKPDNIIVLLGRNNEVQVKIIDWGLAARRGELPFIPNDTGVSGTPKYMSANQWVGNTLAELGRRGGARPEDNRANVRVTGSDILSDLAPGDHLFRRTSDAGPFDAYARAPEGFVPSSRIRIAVAIASTAPKNTLEQQQLFLDAANTRVSDRTFYRRLGRMMGKREGAIVLSGRRVEFIPEEVTVDIVAALEILSSRELIRQFPSGLELSDDKRNEIIRGAYQLYHRTRAAAADPTKIGATDPHPYLYFAEFDARVTALRGRRNSTVPSRATFAEDVDIPSDSVARRDWVTLAPPGRPQVTSPSTNSNSGTRE